jgi:hypothetical protein
MSQANTSNGMLWTGRIISALPVLFMLFGFAYSMMHAEEVKKEMAKYGYPERSMQIVLIVEVVCILLYVIPQTAVLGAILLTGYLGGATATHVRAGEPQWVLPVIVGVLLWLGIYFRDARVRALTPIRRI